MSTAEGAKKLKNTYMQTLATDAALAEHRNATTTRTLTHPEVCSAGWACLAPALYVYM